MIEIANKVYYVGVNDRNKNLLKDYGHCLMVLPTILISLMMRRFALLIQ